MLTFISTAQNKGDSFSLRNYTQIKLNVFSVFDPGAPSVQLGAERHISEKWAVEATIGLPCYIVYPRKNRDSLYSKNLKFKAQIKRYASGSNLYTAFEVFNTIIKYNGFGGEYLTGTGSYTYQSADFRKNIYGAAFKLGVQARLAPKWRLESAYALGARLVNTKVTSSTAYPSLGWFHEWFHISEKVGQKVTPHIALEMKLVYLL